MTKLAVSGWLLALAYVGIPLLLFRIRLLRLGGQPIPCYAQKVPFLGTDFLKAYRKAVADGCYIEFMQENFARYDRTFSATVSGRPWLFTCDPENLQAIHTALFPDVIAGPSRKASGAGFMGDGIFISDGERWRFSRTLFKPLFARIQISDFRQLAHHVDRLFELLPLQNGSTVDLQPMLKAMMSARQNLSSYNDISTESLLGEPIGSQSIGLNKERADVFNQSFETALVGMFKSISSGIRCRWSKERHDWMLACQKVHRVLDQHIDLAIQRREEQRTLAQPSMLEELLHTSIDKVFLRDQLLNVFLGAKDTAGMGIAQIFFHLARHAEVWKKLRAEALDFTNGGRAITFESLKSMTYLQCVLSESLRLHSPVDIAIREAGCDFHLPRGGGLRRSSPTIIPQGARIESCLTVLHRDCDIWGDDAEKFRPERWIGGPLHRWDYLPFSGGARICPAQQTILTQYGYILVRFAQHFEEIKNHDPEQEFVTEVIFAKQSRNGVKVGLYRAKKD